MCFLLQIDQLIAPISSSGVIKRYVRSWEDYGFCDWNTQINFHLIKSRHGLLAQCLQPKEAEVWNESSVISNEGFYSNENLSVDSQSLLTADENA